MAAVRYIPMTKDEIADALMAATDAASYHEESALAWKRKRSKKGADMCEHHMTRAKSCNNLAEKMRQHAWTMLQEAINEKT